MRFRQISTLDGLTVELLEEPRRVPKVSSQIVSLEEGAFAYPIAKSEEQTASLLYKACDKKSGYNCMLATRLLPDGSELVIGYSYFHILKKLGVKTGHFAAVTRVVVRPSYYQQGLAGYMVDNIEYLALQSGATLAIGLSPEEDQSDSIGKVVAVALGFTKAIKNGANPIVRMRWYEREQ